jgi:hypothetical protein
LMPHALAKETERQKKIARQKCSNELCRVILQRKKNKKKHNKAKALKRAL